LSVVVVVAGAG